jgi:DNA-binding response OmpR family regulator
MQSGEMTMQNSLITRHHERPSLRAALESAGFLVFDVSDGGRERERLRTFWAALILLDLPMPRMVGLEILRRLRGMGDHGSEGIIVTHGPIPDVIAAVRLGIVDVLVRPMESNTLRAAVEGIIRGDGEEGHDPSRPRVLVAVDPLVFDLLRAKRALECQEFNEAERLLRGAIERDPTSAVAHTLMGLLHERLGEHHASRQCFRAALRADRCYGPAVEKLRRYRDRFGPDRHSRASYSADDPGA